MSCDSPANTNLCVVAKFGVWPAMLGGTLFIVKEFAQVEAFDGRYNTGPEPSSTRPRTQLDLEQIRRTATAKNARRSSEL